MVLKQTLVIYYDFIFILQVWKKIIGDVQSVLTAADYTRYIVVPLSVGLWRTSQDCVRFDQTQ